MTNARATVEDLDMRSIYVQVVHVGEFELQYEPRNGFHLHYRQTACVYQYTPVRCTNLFQGFHRQALYIPLGFNQEISILSPTGREVPNCKATWTQFDQLQQIESLHVTFKPSVVTFEQEQVDDMFPSLVDCYVQDYTVNV